MRLVCKVVGLDLFLLVGVFLCSYCFEMRDFFEMLVLLILVVVCVGCGCKRWIFLKFDVRLVGQFGYAVELGLGIGATRGSVPRSEEYCSKVWGTSLQIGLGLC